MNLTTTFTDSQIAELRDVLRIAESEYQLICRGEASDGTKRILRARQILDLAFNKSDLIDPILK